LSPPLTTADTAAEEEVEADGATADEDELAELEHAARATASSATAPGPATFFIFMKYLSKG
jgi:hypothetical protein